MTKQTANDILTALDHLLEQERAALLSGNIDQISGLLDKKSELVEALNALEHSHQPALDQLRKKVKRNQVLIDGTLEGIRQVSQRLVDMRRLRHSFDTYDSKGHRKTIDGLVLHHLEKRA